MFKNETHNHPTEIEPFGGAATCLGGAIRDPLSGRSYVYQAMRVTGAGDPTVPLSETLEDKLPQRKLVHRPRLRATPPTATRSAWLPVRYTRSTTRAMWPSAWRSARLSARLRLENVIREVPAAGRHRYPARRQDRPRRLRRRDRLLQDAHRGIP